MRQHVVRIALGLVLVALFVGYAAQLYRVDFITRFDHLLYDTRLRLTAPDGVDDRIVILDMDERSLATPELGRCPWGRDVQAGLVRKRFEKYGVELVAFDVVNGPGPVGQQNLGNLPPPHVRGRAERALPVAKPPGDGGVGQGRLPLYQFANTLHVGM